jgi:hypothetical protein
VVGGGGRIINSDEILFGKHDKKKQLRRVGVGGKISLKWSLKLQSLDWIQLVQGGVHYRNLVNTVMDFRIP